MLRTLEKKPSTIGGIKRLAKQLKKSGSMAHHDALDSAARQASFQNYTHAINELSKEGSKVCASVFFVAYWFTSKPYRLGREVLEVPLSTPLNEVVSPNELKRAKYIDQFRLAASDLLVGDHISRSQKSAREKICAAARALKFMEATGLRPGQDQLAMYPCKDLSLALPHSDHVSHWYDPLNGQNILVDEPYLKPEVTGVRASWASKHNWFLEAVSWPGIYFPGESHLFVFADASTGYDFEKLINKINSLSYCETAENWNGMSEKGHAPFISPKSLTPQEKKNAVSRGTILRVSSNKTIPVRSWNSPYNERRPNSSMTIEQHLLVARMIKALQSSSQIALQINNLLSSVKSKLEDWFYLEHPKEETDKFDLFYYSGSSSDEPFVARVSTIDGCTQVLNELKGVLVEAYVDCAPLRQLIRKIERSIQLQTKKL